MAVCNVYLRHHEENQTVERLISHFNVSPRLSLSRRLPMASAVGALMLLHALASHAQRLPVEDCLKPSEPMLWMPELRSQSGKLRGTITLMDERRRLNDTTTSPINCAEVYLRYFQGADAVPPASRPGSDVAPASGGAAKYKDPVPGPTFRARVDDIVQLTFLNQVDPLNHADTLDRGSDAGACDQFSVGSGGVSTDKGYPGNASDTFPNCFHGSSTANIHFHGTHTNPNSTGDNIFLHVRPSPRRGGKPTVTAESVKASFEDFFKKCEDQLTKDILSEWPKVWTDLPPKWRQEQKKLLKAYDLGKPNSQKLWPENQRKIDEKRWPQYYVGAFPFCFRLPEHTTDRHHSLRMGQAPGTHWYHAHKHGSTALNVSNGMTGAFIIEGKYDDDLNAFYGKVGDHPWTRAQPVLVINQLGQTPNLARNAPLGPQAFSVNGRLQPKLTMRPGEVQLWRIINTSSRGFVSFLAPTDGFEWRQLAQDGVQFAYPNYEKSLNHPLVLAPGNRADILVKAPMQPTSTLHNIMVRQIVTRNELTTMSSLTLMSVAVSGTAPQMENQTKFIDEAHFPTFPKFLEDITDKEVKYSRTLTFDSKGFDPNTGLPLPHQHTIDGEQFSDKIGASVLLNAVEEWKVVNTTVQPPIDHPFHIHINPFQVVEVFQPNSPEASTKGGPCYADPLKPATWEQCTKMTGPFVWWDVFAIPTARQDTLPTSVCTRLDQCPADIQQYTVCTDGECKVTIPGYFKMRSRFVDYPGLYVLHCHILAHEDRGMMTIVEVRSTESPMRHH